MYNSSRRRFLKTSSTALAGTMLGAAPCFPYSKNDKPFKVGLIGAGWYGKSDLFKLIQVAPVEVLALCDVDSKLLEEARLLVSERQQSKTKPLGYKDYKEMLDNHDFDIVLIATPDHWHALQAIDAIKAGAHLYLQKPVSLDVLEGEAILAAARKYNSVVQVGTQRRSTHHLIEAKESIIDKGLLGKIAHVEMCCYYHMRANANPEPEPIPEHFDYERWTGPASMRPYDRIPHRGWWRAFKEYGNGIMGDMCVHMLDTVRWMLDLGWPKRISSTGGIYVQKESKANTPDTQSATFEYEDLNCIWQHRSWGAANDPDYPWAFFVYGEKGTLKASVHRFEFIPVKGKSIEANVIKEEDQFPEDLKEKDIEIHVASATRAHFQNFIEAIKNKTLPVADIEQGHISTASCILANIAMQIGRPVSYDPLKHEVIGDKEATALLKRTYREGYQHPYL